jgi:hypothetical protein
MKIIPPGSRLVYLHGPCDLLHRYKNRKGFVVPSCEDDQKYFTINEDVVKQYQKSGEPLSESTLEQICDGPQETMNSYECELSKMLIFFFKENNNIQSIQVKREKILTDDSRTIYDFPGYVALSIIYNEPSIVANISPHLASVSTSTWGPTGFGSRKCTKSIGFNNYAGKRDTKKLVQSIL